MTPDPYNIFNSPAQQPAPPKSGTAGSAFEWLVMIVLLVVALVVVGPKIQDLIDGDKDHNKDDQEQVDPQPPSASDVAGLVFVQERTTRPIEFALLAREMPAFVAKHNLANGFRDLDDDLDDPATEEAIAYALTKGVQVPFILATDKNKNPVNVIPWELTTTLSDLEKLIK